MRSHGTLGRLAQLAERRPYKAKVGGSRPSAPTTSDLRECGPAKPAEVPARSVSPRLFPPAGPASLSTAPDLFLPFGAAEDGQEVNGYIEVTFGEGNCVKTYGMSRALG